MKVKEFLIQACVVQLGKNILTDDFSIFLIEVQNGN